MSPYSDKNLIKKADDGATVVNNLWREGLRGRSRYENIWLRSYNQYISKSEKITTGFSQLYLDLTRSQVRAFTHQIWMNLFGEVPFVEFEPLGEEDIDAVKISEALVQHAMEEGRLPEEMLHVILGTFIYGDFFIKHTYEKRFKEFEIPVPIYDPITGQLLDYDFKHPIKQTLLTFDGIWYQARSPWRVVIDPAGYSAAPGRTRWIIDAETRVPIERLVEWQKQGRVYNIDKIPENGWVNPYQFGTVPPDERYFQLNFPDRKGLVFLRELWDDSTNERIVIANWDIEIYRGKNPLLGGIPITHFGLKNLPLEPYGMGMAEQLRYMQEMLNTEANLHLDELNLRVHTPVFVRTGIGLRQKLIRMQPGQIIEVAGNPREAAYPLERPSHQTEIFNTLELGSQWAQKATGMSIAAEGFIAHPRTTATATSVATMSQQSFLRFLTMIFGDALGHLAEHNNITLSQFAGPRTVKTLSNDLSPQFVYIRPEELALNVTHRIKDRSHSQSQMERMNTLLALAQFVAPFMSGQIDPKTGGITPGLIDPKEFLLALFKSAQVPGYQRFFSGGVGMGQPNMQALAQQIMAGRGSLPSMEQPFSVDAHQRMGNALGQMASAMNPNGNAYGQTPQVGNLLGIGR